AFRVGQRNAANEMHDRPPDPVCAHGADPLFTRSDRTDRLVGYISSRAISWSDAAFDRCRQSARSQKPGTRIAQMQAVAAVNENAVDDGWANIVAAHELDRTRIGNAGIAGSNARKERIDGAQ